MKTSHEHLIVFALNQGMTVDVEDGGDLYSGVELDKALDIIGSVERSSISIYSDAQRIAVASVLLEYGQSPEDTLSNYSDNHFMREWYAAYERYRITFEVIDQAFVSSTIKQARSAYSDVNAALSKLKPSSMTKLRSAGVELPSLDILNNQSLKPVLAEITVDEDPALGESLLGQLQLSIENDDRQTAELILNSGFFIDEAVNYLYEIQDKQQKEAMSAVILSAVHNLDMDAVAIEHAIRHANKHYAPNTGIPS